MYIVTYKHVRGLKATFIYVHVLVISKLHIRLQHVYHPQGDFVINANILEHVSFRGARLCVSLIEWPR